MPEFELDDQYWVNFVSVRSSAGFTARGVVRHQNKPVKLFETRGRTAQEAAEAAKAKALQIYRRISNAEKGSRWADACVEQ